MRIGGWRYSSTHSWTQALDGGERSASRPGCFTSRERAPGTHWIGLRVCLYAVAKKKSLCSYRKSNAGRPARRLVTILTELPQLFLYSECTEIYIYVLRHERDTSVAKYIQQEMFLRKV